MAKGPPKYPHPKIFGVTSYTDWLKKAHREFGRFNTSTDQLERIDHIFNSNNSMFFENLRLRIFRIFF